MYGNSQFDMADKLLKDIEAVLDPETQTVSIISSAQNLKSEKRQTLKLKSQVKILNPDGSQLDRSQSASLFTNNENDKSLSVIKSASHQPPSASPSSPIMTSVADVDAKPADNSFFGLENNMMTGGVQNQNLDNSLIGLGGNMMASPNLDNSLLGLGGQMIGNEIEINKSLIVLDVPNQPGPGSFGDRSIIEGSQQNDLSIIQN